MKNNEESFLPSVKCRIRTVYYGQVIIVTITDQQKAFVGVDDPNEHVHPVTFTHLVLWDDYEVCIPILRLKSNGQS